MRKFVQPDFDGWFVTGGDAAGFNVAETAGLGIAPAAAGDVTAPGPAGDVMAPGAGEVMAPGPVPGAGGTAGPAGVVAPAGLVAAAGGPGGGGGGGGFCAMALTAIAAKTTELRTSVFIG